MIKKDGYPGYTDVDTELSNSIWQFINEHDNIIRLENAAYLDRTSAESLSKLLIDKYGDKVRADRVKMMIGKMICNVMESRGYRKKKTEARVRVGGLFTRAAKYEPKNE